MGNLCFKVKTNWVETSEYYSLEIFVVSLGTRAFFRFHLHQTSRRHGTNLTWVLALESHKFIL